MSAYPDCNTSDYLMLTPNYYTIDFNGYSMYPALKPGDRLVIRSVAPERIALGDVLVRRNGDERIMVHRLVRRISLSRGITKGDALGQADPIPMVFNGSVERVEAIIRAGRLIVYSTVLKRWRNRLLARSSRLGLSAAAVKQHVKTAMIHRQGRVADFNKSAIVDLFSEPASGLINTCHWPGLLEAIEQEGMAGLAYFLFKDRKVPADAAQILESRYHAIVTRNLACQSFVERLETALKVENIEVMTLKGASLFHRRYTRCGQRPMQDVDLMVRPEDLTRFEQVLAALGFRQNRWRKELFEGQSLTIDLHVHPLHTDRVNGRDSLLAGGIAAIWQNALPWQDGFRWVRRPDNVDNILLLSVHLLKHYYSRLIWLEDVRRLLARGAKDNLTALINRAVELGCTKSFIYTIYVLDTLYQPTSPHFFLPDGLNRSLSSLEKGLLLFSIADRPVSLAAPVLKMFAMRGIKRRTGFALEMLFPNRKVLRAEFGAVTPIQRVFFVPRRLARTLKLMAEHVFVMTRILGRVGK